jgi:hypothetical protein
MNDQNYTSIADLVKKYLEKKAAVSGPREFGPISAPAVESGVDSTSDAVEDAIEDAEVVEADIVQESTELQEVVEHQEVAPDVAPHVEVKQDNIQLSPDLKNAGLVAVDDTKFPSYQNIKLPISDDKVLAGLKAPIYSSKRWLSMWAMLMLLKVHLGLKVVNGKTVRVIQR